jgi:hypothetical protein
MPSDRRKIGGTCRQLHHAMGHDLQWDLRITNSPQKNRASRVTRRVRSWPEPPTGGHCFESSCSTGRPRVLASGEVGACCNKNAAETATATCYRLPLKAVYRLEGGNGTKPRRLHDNCGIERLRPAAE